MTPLSDRIHRLGLGGSQQLPSLENSIGLFKGDLTKLVPLTGHYLFRVGEIATGIALTGNWSDSSWRHALAGSTAVQLFVAAQALFGGLHEDNRLPSTLSTEAFLNGEPGGTKRLLSCWLGRSALIGMGLVAGGARKNVVPQALAGGTVISLMVLFWAADNREKTA